MMQSHAELIGFTETVKTYTAVINGRVVVVEDVPFLIDPNTGEEYLEPLVSQQLYDLVRNPELKTREISADVYCWKHD
jgi:hypothetical protein